MSTDHCNFRGEIVMTSSPTGSSMLDHAMPEILEALRQFKADAAALDDDMHELVMQYPNQWAGMYRGEITIAPTLSGLLELVGDETNVAVRYLDPNPLPLVLAYAYC